MGVEYAECGCESVLCGSEPVYCLRMCDQAQSIKEDEKSLMQELHAEILSEFKKVRVFLEGRRAA